MHCEAAGAAQHPLLDALHHHAVDAKQLEVDLQQHALHRVVGSGAADRRVSVRLVGEAARRLRRAHLGQIFYRDPRKILVQLIRVRASTPTLTAFDAPAAAGSPTVAATRRRAISRRRRRVQRSGRLPLLASPLAEVAKGELQRELLELRQKGGVRLGPRPALAYVVQRLGDRERRRSLMHQVGATHRRRP